MVTPSGQNPFISPATSTAASSVSTSQSAATAAQQLSYEPPLPSPSAAANIAVQLNDEEVEKARNHIFQGMLALMGAAQQVNQFGNFYGNIGQGTVVRKDNTPTGPNYDNDLKEEIPLTQDERHRIMIERANQDINEAAEKALKEEFDAFNKSIAKLINNIAV